MRVFSGCFAVIVLFMSGVVLATDTTTEAERRYLIQAVKELDQMASLMQKAEVQSDSSARRVFYYEAFAADLSEMRRALIQHLESPSRTPRKIKPLRTSSDR